MNESVARSPARGARLEEGFGFFLPPLLGQELPGLVDVREQDGGKLSEIEAALTKLDSSADSCEVSDRKAPCAAR